MMIPRVADLNSNVSGAASTTGSILDTNSCVYMDTSIIMHTFRHIHRGKAKAEYGHSVESHTSTPEHAKSNDNDHCR